MDADVIITIAFFLEVFLFALVAGLFVAHEVRKSPSQATAETGSQARPVAGTNPIVADGTRAVGARAGRAVRGLRA